MDGRALILAATAAAAGIGWLVWHEQQTAAASVAGTPSQPGTDTIDQWKAAALAPQGAHQAAQGAQGTSSTTGALSGLLSAFSGLLGSLGAGQGTSAPQTAQTGTQASAQLYTIGGTAMSAQSSTTTGPSMGVQKILDVVAKGEANNGYDSFYSGSKISPPAPIATMTVAQVMAWQQQSVAAGSVSSAAGRYQVIYPTMRQLVSQGVLSPSETFGKAAQDRAAEALMQQHGLGAYQSGQISAEQFANNLAGVWASLPLVSGPNRGQSKYAGVAGNAARISVPDIMSAVQTV